MSEVIEHLPIDQVYPDPNQPRKTFKEEKIAELAESYKDYGVIVPLEVDENGTIIIGERRWRAAKKAGYGTIPVRRIPKLSPAQRLERQLVEEGHKEQWTPTETAWAYATAVVNINEAVKSERSGSILREYTIDEVKQLPKENLSTLIGFGDGGRGEKSGQSELSRRTGVPQNSIQYFLKIIESQLETQRAIDEEKVPSSYVYDIQAKPKTPEIKPKLEKMAIEGKFRKRDEVREVIKALNESQLTPREQIQILEKAETTEDIKPEKVKTEIAKARIEKITEQYKEPERHPNAKRYHKAITDIFYKVRGWGIPHVIEMGPQVWTETIPYIQGIHDWTAFLLQIQPEAPEPQPPELSLSYDKHRIIEAQYQIVKEES